MTSGQPPPERNPSTMTTSTTVEGDFDDVIHLPAIAASSGGIFATADPDAQLVEIKAKATVLARFIDEQGLARRLSKKANAKPYVQIEGWQFLGSMLGLTVLVEWTRRTDDYRQPVWESVTKRRQDGSTFEQRVLVTPGAGGWEARAVATRLSDGAILGVGEAECLWSEWNWSDRDSYALKSMSQTRASAKAYRGPLAFVMVAAGYAATPAEEMDGIIAAEADTGPPCPACGSKLFDNRAENEARASRNEKNMPAYKCTSRTCTGSTGRDGQPAPWITWDTRHFDQPDATNRAKKGILDVIRGVGADLILAEWLPQRAAQLTTIAEKAHLDAFDTMVADQAAEQRELGAAWAVWTIVRSVTGLPHGETMTLAEADAVVEATIAELVDLGLYPAGQTPDPSESPYGS